jgi:hypothetical protein
MTTVASRIGLFALMAMALAPASWAQSPQCQACVQQETADCVRRVSSSSPPASTPGKPAPVEASGASYCPQSAQNSCKAKGVC